MIDNGSRRPSPTRPRRVRGSPGVDVRSFASCRLADWLRPLEADHPGSGGEE